MSLKNIIKKDNRFEKEYMATVVTNDDPLRRGRLQVKVDAILGDIPFWVNCTNVIGKVNLQLIPEQDDIVSVKFRNKDIYSGEWELKGSPTNGTDERAIDPKKYGLYDSQGNCVIIDRANNSININATEDYNVTVGGNCIINVVGNANITVNGDCVSNVSGSTTHTCANNTINGKLHVTEDITTDASVTATNEVTAGTVTLTGHKHPFTHGGTSTAKDETEPGQG